MVDYCGGRTRRAMQHSLPPERRRCLYRVARNSALAAFPPQRLAMVRPDAKGQAHRLNETRRGSPRLGKSHRV